MSVTEKISRQASGTPAAKAPSQTRRACIRRPKASYIASPSKSLESHLHRSNKVSMTVKIVSWTWTVQYNRRDQGK
jgi:hypothetical protein